MGSASKEMLEKIEREQRTCPDCKKEYELSDSTSKWKCECGSYSRVCQSCQKGFEGVAVLCDSCLEDKVKSSE